MTSSDSQLILIFQAIQGTAQPLAVPGNSLAEVSLHLPQGVYTTFRTYEGNRVLHLDDHFVRLETSARLLSGRPLELSTGEVRQALRQAIRSAGFAESRLRLTAAPGQAGEQPQVFISLEPFTPLAPEVYEQGVHLQTVPAMRQYPEAKTTAFIAPSRQLLAHRPAEVFEYLMVDAAGRLLEGLTSNFFAVLHDEVRTAGAGVLEGITRSIVLDLAARHWPVRLEPVFQTDLPRLSEAFLTSSSREVVPVISLDGQLVGSGRPGSVAQQLLKEYRIEVRRQAQIV